MSKKKRSIALLPHERKVLEDLYLQFRIPVDQFESRPDELAKFTQEFNELTGRVEVSGELIRFMRNRRKNSDWLTLDGNHLVTPPLPPLTAEETILLIQIYKANVTDVFGNCTDVLAHNSDIADIIVSEFAQAAGRVVPAHVLVTKLTALRKRGMLDRVEDSKSADDGDVGFGDIDEATG
jgi:hypothetical protein